MISGKSLSTKDSTAIEVAVGLIGKSAPFSYFAMELSIQFYKVKNPELTQVSTKSSIFSIL